MNEATPTKQLRSLTKLPAELDTSRRTFDRRRHDDPDFPPVLMIRAYVEADKWEGYKAGLIQRALAAPDLSPVAKRRAKERLAEGSAV
jgi:hypothetical protein